MYTLVHQCKKGDEKKIKTGTPKIHIFLLFQANWGHLQKLDFRTFFKRTFLHFGAPYRGGQGGCRVAVTRDTRVVRWDRGGGTWI